MSKQLSLALTVCAVILSTTAEVVRYDGWVLLKSMCLVSFLVSIFKVRTGNSFFYFTHYIQTQGDKSHSIYKRTAGIPGKTTWHQWGKSTQDNLLEPWQVTQCYSVTILVWWSTVKISKIPLNMVLARLLDTSKPDPSHWYQIKSWWFQGCLQTADRS